jgi:hypothetical protein
MVSVFRVICVLGLLLLGPAAGLRLPGEMVRVSVANAQESRVWVNTSSGVYHCPGGRYYGNTKAGE